MSIMVSAEYFGNAIKAARSHNKIYATNMSQLLGCTLEVLHRYECGKDLIPRNILRRVFTLAVMAHAATESK